ncbi:universal stress protein [Halodesulfurarchaeum formicicum]|uniref:universal stress protein n=1 Tax=Halodesulfurarchaeum formicicum TaxID=1873524 RepID=UPI000878CE43|nr:universal stress protein [Halodesulfurarchaeum formicicum]
MTDRPTVLVPIEVLEGESIPEGVPALLAAAHVLVLGYHEVPEQTATEQASEQYEGRATERLNEFAKMFEDAGATVETRLVFTHERQQTINRVILETDSRAVLVPGSVSAVEDVLVAVGGTVSLDRIAEVVGGLFGGGSARITLYHATGGEESNRSVSELLDALEDQLLEAGVGSHQIQTLVEQRDRPLAAIESAAEDYDVVVMGETDPSVATFVFGMPHDQVASQFLGPVLVVQRPPPEPDSDKTQR